MFGFRRAAKETAVINAITLQFEQIGVTGREAIDAATKIVDDVLQAIRPHGIDPFKTTQGNDNVAREQYVAPRLATGLRLDDIRDFWNRPLLLILAETKMREMFNFLIVHVADQQGRDLVQAGNEYKKNFPRFGNPTQWNPNDKYNEGLREIDADIFPEFAMRIEAWRSKTSDTEVEKLIASHGTLNAVVRHLVSTGAL